MSAQATAADDKLSFNVNVADVVRRLWPALRPYRARFGFGAILILLSTGVETVTPLVVGKSVDVAISPGRDFSLLYKICFAYLALIGFRAVVETVQAYVIQATGETVMHDLRTLLFGKIERLPVAYFDKNPTGRLLTRVVNDIKSLSELFTASISVLAQDVLTILVTIVAMLWVNPELAAIVLVTFPVVVITIRLFGRKLALAYRNVRVRLAEINSFLGENIGAIATIQRLGAEEERMERFTRIVDAHNVAQLESTNIFALLQPITNFINGVAMGTLIVVGGYLVIHGRITVGILVAFFGYLRNLFQPVRDLVEKYNLFLSALVSAERVVGILDEKMEGEGGGKDSVGDNIASASIRFDEVSFRYPLRNGNALDKVSFEMEGGSSLAIVGATGSGKSTLIRLLLRFYDPDAGAIWLGGRQLTEWNKGSLRHHIGVVHQEIYLFQGTVRENLTLGREGYSDAYLREKCERAQFWAFIEKRGGLDMPVLEGGTSFSVGERQLLSFARVLVSDPPVLVLDEATSSVDRVLERRLMGAIRETLLGRTSIVIAHRLSTIKQCHRILVLEKGRVVEDGSHEDLLRLNGLFTKFHEIHSRT